MRNDAGVQWYKVTLFSQGSAVELARTIHAEAAEAAGALREAPFQDGALDLSAALFSLTFDPTTAAACLALNGAIALDSATRTLREAMVDIDALIIDLPHAQPVAALPALLRPLIEHGPRTARTSAADCPVIVRAPLTHREQLAKKYALAVGRQARRSRGRLIVADLGTPALDLVRVAIQAARAA